MKVLIDTNVILDVLIGRKPHLESSAKILMLCEGKVGGMITVSQTTDIFYLLRKENMSNENSRKILKKLAEKLVVIDVKKEDMEKALNSTVKDYEDALLSVAGIRCNAKYIITRNTKDFKESELEAISPTNFLERYKLLR